MTGFRFGRSGNQRKRASEARRAIGKRGGVYSPVLGFPMVALRLTGLPLRRVWKSAAKSVTARPHRLLRTYRKRKSGTLPWRLPRPLSADEQMWRDYWIFKASGMLHEWFALYRDVLNLNPPLIHAGPG